MAANWTEFMLGNYKIRRKRDMAFLTDAMKYADRADINYVGHLNLLSYCLRDIERRDEKIRNSLRELSPRFLSLKDKIDKIARFGGPGNPLLKKGIMEELSSVREKGVDWLVSSLRKVLAHQLEEDVDDVRKDVPDIISDYGDVMSGICSLWDIAAKLFWGFYEVRIEEELAKFPYICSFRKDDEDLMPFFMQSGFAFDKKGGAYVKQDSPFLPLVQYRNRVRHNILGAGFSIGLVLGESGLEVLTYRDHHKEKIKEIKVITPTRWKRIPEEGYEHFVKSYNTLIDTFQQTIEKRGWV